MMPSLIPSHVSVFADALKLYDIFSLYRDGRDEMRVIAAPEHRKNLVGERSFVVLRVSLLKPHALGEMTLCPYNVVYVKNKKTREARVERHD